MNQERRRVPRYRLDSEIAVNDGTGRTVDLSAQGVYFETACTFVPGEEIVLVFPFEHVGRAGASVRCSARVVRMDSRGALFGIAATYEPIAFSVSA